MPEYYETTRYLMKGEVARIEDAVLVRSNDEKARTVYELYLKDGIRIGKLDKNRGWVAKILAKHEPQEKTEFFNKILCD